MKAAVSRAIWLLILAATSTPTVGALATTEELARVKRVYDGDTVLLEDGRRVRYLGINTPEYQEPFYLKAKRLNESLVLGREIRLEFDQEKSDSYGRLLAYVYVGNQMVNVRLVQEGLAHAFFIGPSRRHNALLLEAQEKARQRRAGIWSSWGDKKNIKITSVHPADPENPDTHAPYVRIVNLGNKEAGLAGYVLSNESGHRYLFSDIAIDPGYTLIVSGAAGANGKEGNRQGIVHWPGMTWDKWEDTAYLADPSGVIIDSFHYRGKRVVKPAARPRVPASK